MPHKLGPSDPNDCVGGVPWLQKHKASRHDPVGVMSPMGLAVPFPNVYNRSRVAEGCNLAMHGLELICFAGIGAKLRALSTQLSSEGTCVRGGSVVCIRIARPCGDNGAMPWCLVAKQLLNQAVSNICFQAFSYGQVLPSLRPNGGRRYTFVSIF
jgi:hypothetical protein